LLLCAAWIYRSASWTVVIAADNDASGAGEAAAREVAERWLWEDRQVRLMLRGAVGTDFRKRAGSG